MNCKQFEHRIPEFINKDLNYLELKEFSEHMEKCPACKEELVIQFLVTEGVQRLEDGSTFDLQGELNQRLEEAKRTIIKNGRFVKIGSMLELLAIVILVMLGIWVAI